MVINKQDINIIHTALSRKTPLEPNRKVQDKFISTIVSNFKSLENLSAPFSLAIKITPYCNFECTHCWAYPATYKNLVSFEKIQKLIDEAADIGVVKIVLTGGEPLTRKDITKIVSYIKKKDLFLEVFTNGSSRVYSKLKLILDLLSPSTDMIQFSIDGDTSKLHNSIRVKSSDKDFYTIFELIQECTDKKITSRVNMTASQINVSSIFSTYNIVSSYKPTLFRVNPIVPLGRAVKVNIKNTQYEKKYFEEVIKCLDFQNQSSTIFDFSIPISFFKYASNFDSKESSISYPIPVFPGTISLEIMPNGDTYPSASSVYEKSMYLGNIYKEGIMGIWRHPLVELFKKGRDLSTTKCNTCEFLNICLGGKEEQVYLQHGGLNYPDPHCLRV